MTEGWNVKKNLTVTKMDKREVIYVHMRHIMQTNFKLKRATVDRIKKRLDFGLLKSFPAWKNPDGRYVITDGNHRMTALKELGYDFAPIVEISKEEFDEIYHHQKTIDILCYLPQNPKIFA